MKIVDARPVKIKTKYCELNEGELFYWSEDPEAVYMTAFIDGLQFGIRMNDGHPQEMFSSAEVKRVKGHLVVEEIEK